MVLGQGGESDVGSSAKAEHLERHLEKCLEVAKYVHFVVVHSKVYT